jgi:ATPase subunit of ABC transporter with duplicated ATPase domains
MKTCSLCKKQKDLDSFRLRKRNGKVFLRSQCRPCESKAQVLRNRERLNNSPELKQKSLLRVQEWGQKNKKRRLEADAQRRRQKYQEDVEFRAKKQEESAKRGAKKLMATPPWLTEKHHAQMENIYKVAIKVSETTGKPHDVDHIVPLQGKNVCGLHVPWNLAILPASLNRSKGNAYPFINPFS